MTTLRRALSGLYKGESIRDLSALVFAALLVAGQPAWASHGGGGGGGHAGGGGGHASGGSHSGGGGHPSAGHMSTGPSHGPSAHPVGPGGFHGPIRGFGGRGFDGRGFDGRGRFFGHHDFDGRFGFGFPFGFGFGLGLGFGWDYPWGWGPGFYGTYGYYDPWWYGGGYSPGYYGGYYSGGGSSSYSSPRTRDEMGALKLDVAPGDAEVYLNGEYIGRARDFSGWRQDLWLEKGTYDIVLYRDGFKTLARQVTIYPGLVITWDDKLERGQSVRPEDLQPKSHERRDSRLQFERDRAERLDREGQMQRGGPYYDDRRPGPGDDSNGYDDPRGHRQGDQGDQRDGDSGGWNGNWRDRVNRDRGANGAEPQRNARPAPAPGPTTAAITSDRYGRLHLRIEPDDASVYLDGRFVGTGSDVAGNGGGLVLAPGRHKLAVVRPGRKAEERDFEAVLGKDVDLTVNLSESNR